MERKFGRLVEFDEKSRNYPVRTLFTTKKRRSYTWKCPIVLDQGVYSACVGFSVAHEAAARPVMVKNITNEKAIETYYIAQRLDQYESENYDGTSVLGGMKAGISQGWYKSYRWAFGEEDLALAVGYVGPVVLGINWYNSMSCPDEKGIITIGGRIEGGHAIMCNSYNVKKDLYVLTNSWSKDWGINGTCFISSKDMARLLQEDGEAAVPIGRLYGK